uniref:Uncharacterized protein n=1 Tax=Chromera velia CCMP2878 TaxID=1169474 RepID=A0A0G4H4Q0_9ALVE|eukprot:Cvel_24660.t1-p1 / transcript=Cvel_24660.t1 / gene=Cvel_24660 / organism=Chromera_velia_CCMP2878 / gene_product=WD repeat-containing protein 19, putative / transcript_product=WD repeat-containing protein 19, putative / location=Cvel_scaffold2696:7610-21259(-) / protein_length=1511 / sequence_SO=supercontig / SO=protein_coding / is_pseudo=false
MKNLFSIGPEVLGVTSPLVAWQPQGNFLAVAGAAGKSVVVVDRKGTRVRDVSGLSSKPVKSLDWDKDGEILAVLHQRDAVVYLVGINSGKVERLETGKEATFMKWSKVGPQLAVGTSKGALILYNKRLSKKEEVQGKHSKKITCGAWNVSNYLALGGDDRQITVSNHAGESVEQVALKNDPEKLSFSDAKSSSSSKGGASPESSVSVVIKRDQTLFLFSLQQPDDPLELAFQEKYGTIVNYSWYGDGFLILGFSNGYLVVLSTSLKEISEELQSVKFHSHGLQALALNSQLQRVATAGDGVIKLVSTNDWSEVKTDRVTLGDVQPGGSSVAVTSMCWSPEGQLLTAATSSGHVHCWIARLPSLVVAGGHRVAALSSLTEILVTDLMEEPNEGLGRALCSVTTEIEPGFLAVGPSHVAAGMNNSVWFYALPSKKGETWTMVGVQRYPGNVEALSVSATHAAVRVDGKVFLHRIEEEGEEGGEEGMNGKTPGEKDKSSGAFEVLPKKEGERSVSDAKLAGDILVYAHSGSCVQVHSVPGKCPVAETVHSEAVRRVFPNSNGTRIVFEDSRGGLCLFNPLDDSTIRLPSTGRVAEVLWDAVDFPVFAAVSAEEGGEGGRRVSVWVSGFSASDGPSVTAVGSLSVAVEEPADPDEEAQRPREGLHQVILAQKKEKSRSEARKEEEVPVGPYTVAIRQTAVDSGLPAGASPVCLHDGTLTCAAVGGGLVGVRLKTHDAVVSQFGPFLGVPGQRERGRVELSFKQNLALNRFEAAFSDLLEIHPKSMMASEEEAQKPWEWGDEGFGEGAGPQPPTSDRTLLSYWHALGRRALEFLEVGVAKASCRMAGCAALVAWISQLEALEAKEDLRGHVAVLLGRHEMAVELLSKCSVETAVDLLCDLLQWEKARQLCMARAPGRLPEVYLQSAAQSEQRGELQQALQYYEAAGSSLEEPGQEEQRRLSEKDDLLAHPFFQCQAGIARVSLRLGDITRGLRIANELCDPTLLRECAALLEGISHAADAAEIYLKAGNLEKAAALYIQDMNFEAAAPLMSKLKSPKLLLQFAKAKESRGQYMEAATAFERAKDWDNVVRIYLLYLNEPSKAYQVVKDHPSVAAAEMAADYCKKKGHIAGAVEFLMLAGRNDEAFALAESRDVVDEYARVLGESGNPEEHRRVAAHLEGRAMIAEAARQYFLANDFASALRLYLRCGEREITKAIDVVGKARDDELTRHLVSFLLGETDGVPKDPQYVYRLHLGLGNFGEAASTAVVISRQEQESGQYRAAHQLLVNTCKDLMSAQLPVPQSVLQQLQIVHSYVLVKRLVKQGNHECAAHMLLRVARTIEAFPAHIVPILTSVVIECQRAGLKASAHHFGCVLMKPEYRAQVNEQYKKKIENIVRKPQKDEAPIPSSPCPFCGSDLLDSSLDCQHCLNLSPFCIASGYHLLKSDVTMCPSCKFPARHTAMIATLTIEPKCPLCECDLTADQLPQKLSFEEIIRNLQPSRPQLAGGGGAPAAAPEDA